MFLFAALFGVAALSCQTCHTGLDHAPLSLCPSLPLWLCAPPPQMLRNTLAQVVGAEAREEEEAILQVTHPLNVCTCH